MLRPKVLLVGIYDTNTVALAPEILKSYVEQFEIGRAFDVRTLNLSIFSQTLDEMERAIRAEHAEIVGFSTYIWNVTLVRELARRLPGTIVLGGPQLNEIDARFFDENPGVDVVASGEGEETFKELLEFFAGARSLESIAGVRTRDLVTEPRPVLANLEAVPSPYPRIFAQRQDLEWIAYETSRGCPFLCGFCSWGYSKRMRYHALERVFSDLELLFAQDSLTRIYLCDSSILLDKPRAKAILEHVIAKNRDKLIRYEFNAEHLDDEIIELLLKLPGNEFNFGVQTTNPAALRVMRRPFKRARFEENYGKLTRRGERTAITMDVIYGLPGDDYEGFKSSLEYVASFDRVGWILTNPLILLPGSEYYSDREKHGIVLRDEESYIVEATASFSREDMARAIRLSFWVSTVFFNARLRDAVKAFARDHDRRFVDVVEELSSALPFRLIDAEQYPYLVPSIAADFRARNLAIWRVVHVYSELVAFFDHYSDHAYSELLADYREHFGDQYQRLKRFASEEAARCGVPAPVSATPDAPRAHARGEVAHAAPSVVD